jgi:hypothetical protein
MFFGVFFQTPGDCGSSFHRAAVKVTEAVTAALTPTPTAAPPAAGAVISLQSPALFLRSLGRVIRLTMGGSSGGPCGSASVCPCRILTLRS